MTMEMALTVKVKEIFPTMPDDLALKLVPDLNVLTDPYAGIQLPWNRRKRRRLMTPKNVIIHMFGGPDTQFWDRRLANEHTEVLCVDLGTTASANVLDDVTFCILALPLRKWPCTCCDWWSSLQDSFCTTFSARWRTSCASN